MPYPNYTAVDNIFVEIVHFSLTILAGLEKLIYLYHCLQSIFLEGKNLLEIPLEPNLVFVGYCKDETFKCI